MVSAPVLQMSPMMTSSDSGPATDARRRPASRPGTGPATSTTTDALRLFPSDLTAASRPAPGSDCEVKVWRTRRTRPLVCFKLENVPSGAQGSDGEADLLLREHQRTA